MLRQSDFMAPQSAICCCLVTKSCSTLLRPHGLNPPGSSVHGFSRQEYWSGLQFLSPGGLRPSHPPPPPPHSPPVPKDQTCIPFIGRKILYHWATRECNIFLYIQSSLPPSSLYTKKFWLTKFQNCLCNNLSSPRMLLMEKKEMCDITVETPFPGNIPLIPSFPGFPSDLSWPLTLGVLQGSVLESLPFPFYIRS